MSKCRNDLGLHVLIALKTSFDAGAITEITYNAAVSVCEKAMSRICELKNENRKFKIDLEHQVKLLQELGDENSQLKETIEFQRLELERRNKMIAKACEAA